MEQAGLRSHVKLRKPTWYSFVLGFMPTMEVPTTDLGAAIMRGACHPTICSVFDPSRVDFSCRVSSGRVHAERRARPPHLNTTARRARRG
jgi:hypothetical protein